MGPGELIGATGGGQVAQRPLRGQADDPEPDLGAWHESSSWRPAVAFAVTFVLWLAALGVGLSSDRWSVRAAMVMLATLAAAQLFTLGHDAGHGSLSRSPAVNAVVGRLALVPSVHVFGLWRGHHDVHHRYTNLRGRDFVWTPLTIADYRALPGWRRALHRAYRHRSGLGLGLHYAIEIWMPRMLWPRARYDVGPRARLMADTLVLYGLLAGLAVTAWAFVAMVDAGRAGDARFWALAAGLFFVVPLVGTHWLIGFVIYLNHTHPDIVWYDDPVDWSRNQVQLEGSAGQRVRPWALVPRRIMNHTAHHVDPGVPLRRLERAQRQLTETAGHRVISYDWARREFHHLLAHCKLYDYDAQRWLPFPPAEAGH